VFGWGGGSFIALIPVLLANWLGVSRLPQALGMCYSAQATTLLLGPPLVGWLYDGLGSYKVALVIVGCCEFISAAAMCLIPRLVREQVRACGTGSQPAPPHTHTRPTLRAADCGMHPAEPPAVRFACATLQEANDKAAAAGERDGEVASAKP
jgi:MFS family permease